MEGSGHSRQWPTLGRQNEVSIPGRRSFGRWWTFDLLHRIRRKSFDRLTLTCVVARVFLSAFDYVRIVPGI